MPDKNKNNKYNSDIPRPNSYKPKHENTLGKNSDNEQTQYIRPVDSFSDTAELPRQQINPPPRRPADNNNYNRRPPSDTGSQNHSSYQQNNNQSQNYYGQPRQPRPNPSNNSNYTHRQQYDDAPPIRQPRSNVDGGRQRPVNNGQRPPQQRQRNGNPNGQRPQSNRPPQRRNPQAPPPQRTRQRKPKKHRILRLIAKILIPILIIFALIFGIYSFASISFIKKMNYVEDSNRNSYDGLLSENYVKSILLIGTDGRTVSDRGRSDTMILLSINSETKEISLTSFMRDSYVDIDGYGWDKLNAAYSYGGADLLLDTIERNFSIEIDDYISVNFNAFAAVVDAVDGIEIDVSDEEAQAINQILHDEVNELMGDEIDSDYLSSGGKLKLSGKQALSYARIRYVGNSDFERTERQRRVLTQIAGKAKTFNPAKLTKIMKAALPEMTTNMETFQLYLFSLKAPFILGYDIQQLRIPAEDTWGSCTTADGGDALEIDFDTNYDIIKKEVFSD